jgi:hypothetical protein
MPINKAIALAAQQFDLPQLWLQSTRIPPLQEINLSPSHKCSQAAVGVSTLHNRHDCTDCFNRSIDVISKAGAIPKFG